MSDKKLEFALQFAKAPKELQVSAQALHDGWVRGDRAVAQLKLWKKEGAEAQESLAKLSADFEARLAAWDDGSPVASKLEVLK